VVVHIASADAPSWVLGALVGLGALGRTGWVGVDGFGAAGKTSLAAAVAAAVPGAVVVHVDDFARAGVRGWERDRFATQVVEPLLAGRPGRYQRWDLITDVGLDWLVVPVGVLVIVEGVSATDDRLPVPWDVTLWVEAAADVRWQRIAERDTDPALRHLWLTDWLPSEQAYEREQNPRNRVDAVVQLSLPNRSRAESF
jgi:predicted kinase